jgi:hypothetical protein
LFTSNARMRGEAFHELLGLRAKLKSHHAKTSKD